MSIESKIMDLLSRDGGMLMAQLYRALPESERPSYSSFTRLVKTLEGVRSSLVYRQSPNKFLTVLPRISPRKKKLLALVSEFRLLGHNGNWYVPLSGVPSLYARLRLALPASSCFDREELNSIEYLKDPASVACPFLFGLVRRGIYPSIRRLPDGASEFAFVYVDISNRIYKNDMRSDFALMCAFMAYHRIALPWRVLVVAWSSESVELYKAALRAPSMAVVDCFSFSDNFHTDGIAEAMKKDFVKSFLGFTFFSTNLAQYFNPVSLKN